jgi:hypothetical protein
MNKNQVGHVLVQYLRFEDLGSLIGRHRFHLFKVFGDTFRLENRVSWNEGLHTVLTIIGMLTASYRGLSNARRATVLRTHSISPHSSFKGTTLYVRISTHGCKHVYSPHQITHVAVFDGTLNWPVAVCSQRR